MKIAICGSMAFAKQMILTREKLEAQGHEVSLPVNADQYADGRLAVEDKWQKMEHDLIRNWFEVIKVSDAILVLNYTKNGVENYVGGNSLIEMAFAHVLHKKIFLLYPVPKMLYTDEIAFFAAIVINDDYSLIK